LSWRIHALSIEASEGEAAMKEKIEGVAKEAIGKLTGDEREQLEGDAQQKAAELKEKGREIGPDPEREERP
jgi:uncharacterized protein YjbJ (UPF0337 family)